MTCPHTNCWCHMDWHCEHAGLARVFGGTQQLGDSYCYALPFVVRERFEKPDAEGKIGKLEFIGVLKAMTPCQYRAMRKAARDEGWRILSTRVHDGQYRTIEICSRGTD